MPLRTIFPAVLLLAATAGNAAARSAQPSAAPETLTVTRRGGEFRIGFGERFRCCFRRCMFNELFTFYETAVGEHLFNRATSDNIGPLAIEGQGWIGGNHSYRERGATCTARHVDVEVVADGQPLDRDTTVRAHGVTIRVENLLLDPRSPSADSAELLRPFCRERVIYRVRENNIEVAVTLCFLNAAPAAVRTYYGMQSMFCDETHTLTPGGAYTNWTPQDSIAHFTKRDYPAFERFVEKNDRGYQATWLLPEGAGDHELLADTDAVFIGNSYGKSYHRLLAGREVRAGDEIRWRGVYTWFATPIADDDALLCYEAIEGRRRILFIDCKKECDRTVTIPGRSLRSLRTIGSHGDVRIRRIGPHTLRIRSTGPASVVYVLETFPPERR